MHQKRISSIQVSLVMLRSLAFQWALIVHLYWQTYSDIHMKQNLLRNLRDNNNKKRLALSFNHTFRYIDDVQSINNHNIHNYIPMNSK